MLNRSAKASFPCPRCKAVIEVSAGDLMNNKGKCPYCNFDFDSPAFKKDAEKTVKKMTDEIEQTIKRNFNS